MPSFPLFRPQWPGRGPSPRSQQFLSKPLAQSTFSFVGITRDGAGNTLINCTVKIYQTSTDILLATTNSDGSGIFRFTVPTSDNFYIVAYKPGGTDLAGTTVNNLRATEA